MKLNTLRRRIDAIDLVLLRLLNRRASLAIRIAHLKRQDGRPVFDPARESQILRRIRKANGGPLSSRSAERIFREILRISRQLEKSAGDAR